MPTHNQLIQNALARGVRAGTVLQDAIIKVRRARRQNDCAFEIALGELFILASNAFKERNAFKEQVRHLQAENAELRKELQHRYGECITQNSGSGRLSD